MKFSVSDTADVTSCARTNNYIIRCIVAVVIAKCSGVSLFWTQCIYEN